eukprot:NODE_3625_length_944_cov_28.985475_g3330_i0.p1 GENE.NODE_3625_length_944_cov_28.985475_g3330_i0~~NODE_3625_length_944_cov_28.985475_g3330_i0.p1  ORF type:complete len:236 (+),score=21.08 NODE_3625_length_944_cov_28.985475_g3330_i0:145-852(+)
MEEGHGEPVSWAPTAQVSITATVGTAFLMAWKDELGSHSSPISFAVGVFYIYNCFSQSRTLFWRGSPTGFGVNERRNHRLRLVEHIKEAARSLPVGVDVGFHALFSDNPPWMRMHLKNRVDFQRFSDMRYLLDIDGNAYSTRTALLLRTGSLVMRTGVTADVLTLALEDRRDYVRFNITLEDLDRIVKYYAEHDDEAQRIASTGRNSSYEMTSWEYLDCYAYHLITRYAKYFQIT